MDWQTAVKINTAACRVYLFREGLNPSLPCEDARIVQSVSIAQIETAVEIVEAINRDRPSVDGKTVIQCTLETTAIPGVKRYADTWEK